MGIDDQRRSEIFKNDIKSLGKQKKKKTIKTQIFDKNWLGYAYKLWTVKLS